MRIGVDYRLANRHLGGMAVYLRSLVGVLKKLDPQNEYVLFDDNPSGQFGFRKQAWTIIWEHLWLQLRLPYLLGKERIDVAYFPNPPVSFFLAPPIVLTIPDASFMHDSSLSTWLKSYLWVMYFLSARRARAITTFSQNSKRDIESFFGVKADKIHVISLAPSPRLAPQRSKGKRDQDYVITIPGTFIPRKNVKETILAFKQLPAQLRNTHRLVVVGYSQSETFKKIKDFVTAEEMTDRIVFTGRVSDHQLADLYSHAKLFVCSSLYEGFGLPILEAMKCGVPVISYANSSLPEVVGQAGILVNNCHQLSQAMARVLESPTLRKRLRQSGLRRAAVYSWDKTARSFLEIFSKNVNR